MALALNTSHALYADLIALICVDDDNTIKDLKGDTCTPNAAVVVGSGTYGRHFRTTNSSNDSLGVALTNGFQTKPIANPVGTTFVVINAGNGWASRGSVFPSITNNVNSPRVTTGDVVAAFQNDGTSALGSIDVIGTGAHSFGIAYTGTTSHKAFTDGGNVVTSATSLGNASDAYKVNYIGGHSSGGYGYLNADYVWVAHFRRFLSDAEIADLHASLGASNAFGLVVAAGAASQISATTDDAVFSGASVGYSASSSTQITATTADAVFSGGAVGDSSVGTVTTSEFKNESGTLLTALSVDKVWAIQLSGTPTFSSAVTNGAGQLVLSGAALMPGVDYLIVSANADGSAVGVTKHTAS